MTDDRTLERAARSWLEEGPTQAPDRPVDAALARIQTTAQERDLRIPWRPKTMMDRLAAVAMAAVLVIGTVAFGSALIFKPTEPAASACPREFTEAEAIDTFEPGLIQGQRVWGIAGGTPERVGSGPIVAFSTESEDAPLSVITIDPVTGKRCRLVRMAAAHRVVEDTTLDWSPAGDALAIGIELAEERGVQALIWTPTRLLRVWRGPGQTAYVGWAPDGRSIAVWSNETANVRVSFADGSPDRLIDVLPLAGSRLAWSPDGSRWIVGQGSLLWGAERTELTIVNVGDGRLTPIDVGVHFLMPEAWLDNETVLLEGFQEDHTPVGHLAVPLADPAGYSVISLPDEDPGSRIALSPDRRRLAYVTTGGQLHITDVTASASGSVVVAMGDQDPITLHFAWSPDGGQVVFSYWGVTGLWITNADGTGARELATGWFPFVDPWQPVPVR